MQHRYVFEAVDRIIRHLTDTPNAVFGEKTVVFGGDFRQALLIIVRGSQSQIVDACLKNSDRWGQVEVLKLTQNMRVKGNNTDDRALIDFLLRVGKGTEPAMHAEEYDGYVRIPDYIFVHTTRRTHQ